MGDDQPDKSDWTHHGYRCSGEHYHDEDTGSLYQPGPLTEACRYIPAQAEQGDGTGNHQ
ncbi:hypothetical protein D3C75_1249340 [compost metagenome]